MLDAICCKNSSINNPVVHYSYIKSFTYLRWPAHLQLAKKFEGEAGVFGGEAHLL